jgi:hypothetical protein
LRTFACTLRDRPESSTSNTFTRSLTPRKAA